MLTAAQQQQLCKPIKPSRVYTANGNAHVPGWDDIAHLNRVFGFGGWKKEVLCNELVFESEVPPQNPNGRSKWTACYRATVRLTVFGIGPQGQDFVSEDSATGVGENQPKRHDAHDKAYKEAVTYGLKRCAKDLGDQFGLSLYNKGSLAATTTRTLVGPGIGEDGADVEANVPVPQSMGNDERHDYADDADPAEPGPARDGTGYIPEQPDRASGAAKKAAPAKAVAKRAQAVAKKATAARPDPRPADPETGEVELATQEHLATLMATGAGLTPEQSAQVKKWRTARGITSLALGTLTVPQWKEVVDYMEEVAGGDGPATTGTGAAA